MARPGLRPRAARPLANSITATPLTAIPTFSRQVKQQRSAAGASAAKRTSAKGAVQKVTSLPRSHRVYKHVEISYQDDDKSRLMTIKTEGGANEEDVIKKELIMVKEETFSEESSGQVEDMKFKLEKKLKLDSAFAALVQAEGDKEASLSPNWTQEHQEVFAAIEAYRKGVVAPVDWCGCSSLGRQEFGDKVYRFEVLVALILSAQTPDLKLGPVMKTLQAKFPDGMTPEAFLATDVDNIKACLQTIGMQNQKTKALMGTSAMCVELYGGDIPPTFETLQALPGVGPKIAALVMSNAWKENVAIGVDTHVHRIANRLGWVATRTPEHTMRALQLVMPRKLWGPVNPLLVGFGQTLCSAVNPGCATCPVKERCPKIGTKSRKK